MALFPANGSLETQPRRASTLSARCGRPTGSDCRSGSGSGSAGCSRRSPRRAAGRRVAVVAGGGRGSARRSATRSAAGTRPSAGGIGGALGAGVVATLVAGTLQPRRHARRDGAAGRPRRARARRARARPVRRLPRGGRASRARRPRPPPPARALRRPAQPRARLSAREEADPGRHRRPHAGGLRGRRRDRVGAGAGVPRRARQLPPRRLDVPVADAGLPLLDRDGRAPRRAPDPAPRLVAPRRAAPGRVRLLVRGDPRGRDAPLDRRHDLQHERAAPRPRRRRPSTRRSRTRA